MYYNLIIGGRSRVYLDSRGRQFCPNTGYMIHIKRLASVHSAFVSSSLFDNLVRSLLVDKFQKDYICITLDGSGNINI